MLVVNSLSAILLLAGQPSNGPPSPPLWFEWAEPPGIGAIVLLLLGAWLRARQSDFEARQQKELANANLEHERRTTEFQVSETRKLAESRATQDRDIARLQSKLERLSFEHRTRYSNLHDLRAKIIAELYTMIVETEDAWNTLLSPATSPHTEDVQAEREARAIKAANDYRSYFRRSRIYFDSETCADLEEFDSTMFQVWVQWYEGVKAGTRYSEEWMRAWNQVRNVAPAARARLEDVFRMILGVGPNDVSRT